MNSTFSPIHSAKEPKLCNSFPSFSFSASLFSSTRFFVRLFLLLCSFSLPFLWMNLTRENTKHSNKNRNFIYDFQNSQRLNRMCAKHENFCTVNIVRLSYSVSLSLSLPPPISLTYVVYCYDSNPFSRAFVLYYHHSVLGFWICTCQRNGWENEKKIWTKYSKIKKKHEKSITKRRQKESQFRISILRDFFVRSVVRNTIECDDDDLCSRFWGELFPIVRRCVCMCIFANRFSLCHVNCLATGFQALNISRLLFQRWIFSLLSSTHTFSHIRTFYNLCLFLPQKKLLNLLCFFLFAQIR